MEIRKCKDYGIYWGRLKDMNLVVQDISLYN